MKTFSLLVIWGLLSFASFSTVKAQVWVENFDTYANGTTVGTSGRWTSSCPACLSGDYFEVQNGAMEANDVNDWVTWETELIDISACPVNSVTISVDVVETGDHEGPGCACGINIDYFDLYYSIDGGAYTVVPNWMGDGEPTHTLTGDSQNGVFTDLDFGSHTVVVGGLSGTSVRIMVQIRNTAGSEFITFDNVIVDCALPVEWESFAGRRMEEDVLLNWSTASEVNNHFFEVERSLNGQDFASIGRVEARGARSSEYSFRDAEAPGSRVFYRLRQVDLDGAQSFSKVVEVIGIDQKLEILGLSPNPAGNHASLQVQTQNAGDYLLQIHDLNGKLVQQKGLRLADGDQAIDMDLSAIPQGMYLLRLSGQGRSSHFRLLKNR